MMRPILVLLLVLPLSGYAGEARDLAEDPVIEKRLIVLAESLRCLVCQNESLASSHAELAEDLRREVRSLMREGKSDQEVKDYLVARYGDFVLYEPPVKGVTILLWIGPFLLLLVGMSVLLFQINKRKVQDHSAELNPEAMKEAAKLLEAEKE